MRNIRVTSLMLAPLHVKWAEQVISLVDHDIRDKDIPKAPRGTRHLIVTMEDIETEGEAYAPTRRDIEHIFKWFRVGKRTLIHCHAGLSRSVSVAMGLMLLQGMTYDEAGDEVTTMRGDYIDPNVLIASHIDDILGHGGAFLDYVRDRFHNGGDRELYTAYTWVCVNGQWVPASIAHLFHDKPEVNESIHVWGNDLLPRTHVRVKT